MYYRFAFELTDFHALAASTITTASPTELATFLGVVELVKVRLVIVSGCCPSIYVCTMSESQKITVVSWFPVLGKHRTPTGCGWLSCRQGSHLYNFTTNAHAEVFLYFLLPIFTGSS